MPATPNSPARSAPKKSQRYPSKQVPNIDNILEGIEPLDMQLKKDSSQEISDAIRSLEQQAERCFENLRLYAFPKGLAAWATLTHLVAMTEQHRATQGYANYDAALVNLGLQGALILRWIRQNGNAAKAERDHRITREFGEVRTRSKGNRRELSSFPEHISDVVPRPPPGRSALTRTCPFHCDRRGSGKAGVSVP